MIRETMAMAMVSCTVIAARVMFKSCSKGQSLWWDEYTLVASSIVGVPENIMEVYFLAPAGVGRDIWTLPFERIDRIFQITFVSPILYFPQVAILKLSFLFFYLRIFPAKWTRWLIWGTIIVNVLYGLAFTSAAIFQCQPVSAWWVQ